MDWGQYSIKGLLPAKIGISVFQMARVLNALNTYRGPAITTPKYRTPGCVVLSTPVLLYFLCISFTGKFIVSF